MISLIMSVYNGEKFIEKQILSILQQEILPSEIIIIDDCSTDSTVDIIMNTFKKNNYLSYYIVKNNNNMGYINSFLKGIHLCKGEYIFLCDQDDIWYRNKIKILYNHLKNNTKILSICSSFDQIDQYDKIKKDRTLFFRSNHNLIKKRIKKSKLEKIRFNEVVQNNISPGCTCAFKRTIISDLSMIETNELIIPHDYLINLLAAQRNGLYFYNVSLIGYRQHDNNTIGLKKANNSNYRIELYKKILLQKEQIKKITSVRSDEQINYLLKSINDRIHFLQKRDIFNLIKSMIYSKFKFKLCIDNYYLDIKILLNEKYKK